MSKKLRDEIEDFSKRLQSVEGLRAGTLRVRTTGNGGSSYTIETSARGSELREPSASENSPVEIAGDAEQLLSVLQGKEDAREAFQQRRVQVRGNLGYLNELLLEARIIKPIYSLLRVTAVLTANSAGTQSLGEVVRSEVRPTAPYLRNPSIHTQPESNYVRDEIDLANFQLLSSGACFGLDTENIRYVLEPSDLLHSRECGDAAEQATVKWLAMKAAEPIADNPYRDSVIIIYRWGSGASPSLQGCSCLDSPYILMPGQYNNSRFVDGRIVLGNNHLTHELGHFMGLEHTFSTVADRMVDLADLRGRNSTKLPLTLANLANLSGVTARELYEAKALAERYIATWPYALDQDAGIRANLPETVTVEDTPVDIGPALPLLFGFPACGGQTGYKLTRYEAPWLQQVNDSAGKLVWWQPTFDAEQHQFQDHVQIDDRVTSNAMSYWACDPASQGFSADQVRRMHFVLTDRRRNLIGRTITLFDQWLPTRESLKRRAAQSLERLSQFDRSSATIAGSQACGVR